MPDPEERPSRPRHTGWAALAGLVAAALVLSGSGAMVLAAGMAAPSQAEVIGQDVPVNAGAGDLLDISAHNSPRVSRNPADGTNLVTANRIDAPRFSCALHVSFDGGGTWSDRNLPLPEGEEPKCYGPDVGFGPDGRLHVAFVTLRGPGNVPNAVWLVSSVDGGRTLTRPTRALGPLAFQVRLVVDPVVTGRLYLAWLQAADVGTLAFPATGYPILLARSEDDGATWGPSSRVSDPVRARAVAPAVAIGARGQLFVLYLDLGDDRLDFQGAHDGRGGPPYGGPWKLVLARSEDGGFAWTESVVEAHAVPTQRFVVFTPPLPSLAVDRGSGRVYAAFADGRLGDPDVLLWASDDDGRTFASPVRVNDTWPADGTSQYLPALAVAPAGRLDIAYYDRRHDPADVMNEVSLQSSTDGGRTFSASLRLSGRPFDSRIGPGGERGLADPGSGLGLVSTETRALAVWPDTRAGTPVSGKQDLLSAAVQVAAPGVALRTGLLWIGGVLAGAGLVLVLVLQAGLRRERGRRPGVGGLGLAALPAAGHEGPAQRQ